MDYNSYRTRYVGEALRSAGRNRVTYTENSDATEVLCLGFTYYTLIYDCRWYCRTGTLTCELSA
jgi:hypothetical protein